MPRLIPLLLFCWATVALAHANLPPIPPARGVVVFVTRTGEKYHRGACRYLDQSKLAVKLGEARRAGHDPCRVCSPHS